MKSDYGKQLYKDYEEVLAKNDELNKVIRQQKDVERLYKKEIEHNKKLKNVINKKDSELAEKDKEIAALKKEILRLNGVLGLDSNNSSLPTSQTPISKNKRVPNSRKHSGKKQGGQPGHQKAKLEAFDDDEVTEDVEHALDKCPDCGGELVRVDDDEITRDETDYDVVLIRRRHHFPKYKCTNCGKVIRADIPQNLTAENQYGSGVKALALLLMNTGNVSVNKVRKMIYGLSGSRINPSEGYIIKLQKTAAKALEPFLTELHKAVINLELLYWDDTVISVHPNRACMRFYGNEQFALYKAHMKKNKEGLDEDNILSLLPSNVTVMHDHNKINYSKEYQFNNIECNAHLLRDLEFVAENLPEHTWAKILSEAITATYNLRNKLIENGINAFSEEYTQEFFMTFDMTMLTAVDENTSEPENYYTDKERQLIKRLMDYKDNYFAWVVNFEFPFTNNLSERSLRIAKTKMKVSGQFQSEAYAQNYVAVRSYVETCYRNGVNEYEALRALCDGKPLTLQEVLNRVTK